MVEEVTWEDTWTNSGAVEFGVYESHMSYFWTAAIAASGAWYQVVR